MKTNRRKFFKTMGVGAGLGLAAPLSMLSSESPARDNVNVKEDQQVLFIGDNVALADTVYGKVRGFRMKDIYTFLGIPYGASTAGKNRFMPPQKPAEWKDVFPAVYWGNAAPQNLENFYANRYLAFTDDWHYDDVSEDCLRINVWTPGVKDGKKRPVMFWIHGGGFTSGNAIEHPEYHGENFARYGDVVFCSINHRLGPLGFANFAGVAGERYAASGNVGMLDIVAALEWVRDNVSNFGGDPNNVTIMGQSGGGAKVCTLMAMPSAKGLFHKAVALSGSSLKANEKVDSEKLGSYILREASLNVSEIDKLQDIPWKDFLTLANNANRKLREDAGIPSNASPWIGGFRPVVDGIHLPQHPFFPEASPHAANVPMMICTTFYERSPSSFDSSMENITKEEAKEQLKTIRGFGSSVGENASAVYDAYEQAFPDRKPIEILSMAISNRKNAVALADVKSKQAAPVYLAWFGWNPPLFDGRLRAFHTLDICFWFYNTDRQLSHSGGGARPRKLSEKMAGSLLQFMKTGKPNTPGLPSWPRYSSTKGETMVLNDVSSIQNDPDREARKSLPPS
ncbi:MAG TPA: carboxylesterase family protein [Cyclobacteriaceae bacterium]|nr:carboxylesterase family protein [Cyclobacteriaceae bacterium]